MKNLNYILTLFFALTLFVGCDTDPDNNAPIADENGFLVDIRLKSTGVFLASPNNPNDIENTEVSVQETSLNIVLDVVLGNTDNLEKVEVYKSFNGGEEILVHESNSLSTSFQMNSMSEFLEGTGAVESDLRIGDEFLFRTKVYKKTGEVYYFNSSMGDFSVVIKCGSDLAGAYTTTAPPLANVTLTETGTGVYEQSALPRLTSGGNPIPFEITDTCGTLNIDTIVLGGYLVKGSGIVNADGSYVINGYILYNSVTVDSGPFFDFSTDVYTYTPQ